ncbi:MAG TPA: thiamine phosphate synthase [Sphingobium sp.]|uniref:thiamine phosphate synthase n=1 Tax=Sphingobium sp. TaxID=1912891 RepID=UPI002ED0773A
MTDERVGEDRLIRAARRLPRGSGIVLRHYSLPEAERRDLFERLRPIARRRGLVLFIAGDAAQAAAWGADGSHGGAGRRYSAPLTMPVHDAGQLRLAERRGADIVFLSPLFATRSHPGHRPLGAYRFAALARMTRVPVMALGGVGARHAGLIRRLGARGFGAIDALTR